MPYLGGVGPYAQFCAQVAASGYDGFALAPGRATDGAERRAAGGRST
jgi:hypothetical protein